MDTNSVPDGSSCAGAQKLPCQETRHFPADLACSVIIHHVENDGSLWVMFESDMQIMEVLSDALNNSDEKVRIINPVVNQVVAALNADHFWYRAVIKTTDPDISVQFIDFGDQRIVPIENIAALPATLSIIHPLAMKVQLPPDSRITPVAGASLLVQHVFTSGEVVVVDAVVPGADIEITDSPEEPVNNENVHCEKVICSDVVTLSFEGESLPVDVSEKIRIAGNRDESLESTCLLPAPAGISMFAGKSSLETLDAGHEDDMEVSNDESVPIPSEQIVEGNGSSEINQVSLVAKEIPEVSEEAVIVSNSVSEEVSLVENLETLEQVIAVNTATETQIEDHSEADKVQEERANSDDFPKVWNVETPEQVVAANTATETQMEDRSEADKVQEEHANPDDFPQVSNVETPEQVIAVSTATETQVEDHSESDKVQEQHANPDDFSELIESKIEVSPQSEMVQNGMPLREDSSSSKVSSDEPGFHQFISALDRYPHLGGGYAQDVPHSSGIMDVGPPLNNKVNHHGNVSGPRIITKGRNTQSPRPVRPQPQEHVSVNARLASARSSAFASTPNVALQKSSTSNSPQDFKTILEFELSIIREQNRLQMLQLQKKMEQNLANHMKSVKEEMTRQLAAFRNEVNGRLMIVNDSVVHKMADIYSDIALLKNDKEINKDTHFSQSGPSLTTTGEVHHYPKSGNLKRLQNARLSAEDSGSGLNSQHHFKDAHQKHDFISHQVESSNGRYEKGPNNMEQMTSNRHMVPRKDKNMKREGGKYQPNLGNHSMDQFDHQNSNFPVGQFSSYSEYPKVDHFDPSKAGVETNFDSNSNKGSSGSIICVNNLCAEKITPDLLFNLIGVYGNVLRVKISQQDKGRAFVEMADSAQAEEAVRQLNHAPLMGQRLHVTRCSFERLNLTRQEFQSNTCKDYTKPQLAKMNRFNFVKWDSQKVNPPSQKLVITNVLNSVTDEKIKEEFAKRGFHIQNLHCQPTSNDEKKIVFVTLNSLEEAVNALTVMHLQELSDWMMMRISFAKYDRKFNDN